MKADDDRYQAEQDAVRRGQLEAERELPRLKALFLQNARRNEREKLDVLGVWVTPKAWKIGTIDWHGDDWNLSYTTLYVDAQGQYWDGYAKIPSPTGDRAVRAAAGFRVCLGGLGISA